jgi:hypothetical protein
VEKQKLVALKKIFTMEHQGNFQKMVQDLVKKRQSRPQARHRTHLSIPNPEKLRIHLTETRKVGDDFEVTYTVPALEPQSGELVDLSPLGRRKAQKDPTVVSPKHDHHGEQHDLMMNPELEAMKLVPKRGFLTFDDSQNFLSARFFKYLLREVKDNAISIRLLFFWYVLHALVALKTTDITPVMTDSINFPMYLFISFVIRFEWVFQKRTWVKLTILLVFFGSLIIEISWNGLYVFKDVISAENTSLKWALRNLVGMQICTLICYCSLLK